MKKFFMSLIILISTLNGLVSCGKTQYVNFYNYDGTLLYQTVYTDGMTLSYQGQTPKKVSDEMYDYTFSSWSHEFSEVDTYKNFYAIFDKKLKQFSVEFYDHNSKLLDSFTVEYGSNVSNLAPKNLSRQEDLRTKYYFAGWGDVDLTYITENVKCYATYTTVEKYKVEYRDYDNTLLKEVYIEKGGDYIYSISNFREADETHYYVFNNWSEEVSNVQCDMIVKAEYKLIDACIVTFKNYDGSILGTSKGPVGFTANYDGETPVREPETSGYYKYTYTFTGWNKNLTNVKTSFDVYAEYSTSSTYYNPDYQDALNEIIDNAVSYNSDTKLYYKGFHMYLTSTYLEAGYAEYDPSNSVVDLYYIADAGSNSAVIIIYFDTRKPGEYYCTYSYFEGNNKTAMGIFNIDSYWSNGSQITFKSISNFSSSTNSSHVKMASNLVSTCLEEASSTDWIDTYKLGFVNY